jgi:hypothetical protein
MDSLVLVVSEKMARLEGLSLPGKRGYPERVNEDNQEA